MKKNSKILAGLLAIFLGSFGIHKFYLGKVGQGILYLLFCWTSLPAIISIIEGIIYLVMSEAAFDAKYNKYAAPINITISKDDAAYQQVNDIIKKG